ncbi:MAG: hypothetical protein WBA57_00100, partial [Elainellaceae cyanobacterium]
LTISSSIRNACPQPIPQAYLTAAVGTLFWSESLSQPVFGLAAPGLGDGDGCDECVSTDIFFLKDSSQVTTTEVNAVNLCQMFNQLTTIDGTLLR